MSERPELDPTATSLSVFGTMTGPSSTPLLSVRPHAEPASNGALVIAVTGEVDLDTASLLQAVLVDALDRRSAVCCDLSATTFLSAAGITALMKAYERALDIGARLTVRGANGVTRRVLRIAGVERLLDDQTPDGKVSGSRASTLRTVSGRTASDSSNQQNAS